MMSNVSELLHKLHVLKRMENLERYKEADLGKMQLDIQNFT